MPPWLIRTALLFLGLFTLSRTGLAQQPARPQRAEPTTIRIQNPTRSPAASPRAEPLRGPRLLDTRTRAKTTGSNRTVTDNDEARRQATSRVLDDLESIRKARSVTPSRQSALRDDLRDLLGDRDPSEHHPFDSMANDLAWTIADGGITRASASLIAESLAILGDPAASRDDHLQAIAAARRVLNQAGVSDRDQKAMAIHLHELSVRARTGRPSLSTR